MTGQCIISIILFILLCHLTLYFYVSNFVYLGLNQLSTIKCKLKMIYINNSKIFTCFFIFNSIYPFPPSLKMSIYFGLFRSGLNLNSGCLIDDISNYSGCCSVNYTNIYYCHTIKRALPLLDLFHSYSVCHATPTLVASRLY